MTENEILHCLTIYKKHLENNKNDFVYVNELKHPYTDKAVVVSLFCIDFETKENEWSDVHKTCSIHFWVPRKLSWYHCGDACNAKIPKWLALKNLEKCIELKTTNLWKRK